MLPRNAHPALLAAATAAALLAPSAAQAATTTIYAGPPVAKAKAMPPDAVGNAFYPRAAKVGAGGKVRFKIGGFHNVVFAPKGKPLGPLAAPDPARPVSGAKDPAGADLWFNGQPGVFMDPAHLAPAGDKKVDGKALDASGVFQGEGAPPDFVVSFPKAGTYRYLCTVHPGMKGSVKVLPKGAKAPSKAKHAKALARQVAATVKKAKRLAAEVPAGNVVRAGNDRGEVAFLSFFPGARQVAADVPVRFEISSDSTELHNVVFGPEAFLAERAAAFISPGPQGIALDPLAVYPSDPGPIVLDGANHGNGFAGTGLIDAVAATPFPSSASVTFAKPGSYGFICTVHGAAMKGTIEVS